MNREERGLFVYGGYILYNVLGLGVSGKMEWNGMKGLDWNGMVAFYS